MTAVALTPEAARLRGYLGWAVIPTFLAGPMLIWLSTVADSTFILIVGVLTLINAPIDALAYYLAGRNRIQSAIGWLTGGLWSIALALALTGTDTLGLIVLLALLPVALAVPCISPRGLLVMAFVGCCLVLVAGAVGFLDPPPFPLQEMPELPVKILLGIGVTLLTAVCGVSIWQNRMSLHQVLTATEAAGIELAASEKSLERRVHERTAELEASERELAEARDAAIEANRRKSEFLGQMSHELRTPLNAILGFSEVLANRIFGPLNDKQAEYVNDIHQSGRHLLSLISDVLDLSRIEAGRLELAPSRFDLRTTIENALVLVRERAVRRGVEVSADVDPALGEIDADERKIRQVLINLLTNAVKFTRQGGLVSLRARLDGSTVTTAITDTGVGISPKDLAVIFEDYGQAAHDRSADPEGTGLGLPLSKKIIELHGGSIGVESVPGRGSAFTFTIPLTRPPVPDGAP